MNQEQANPPSAPYLCVNSFGQMSWIGLDVASNALIGSGGHCKVQITGSDVRSLHCIVAMKDGRLEVRDWNTGCTYVNGQVISEPTEMTEGDCLKIGDHEITVVLSDSPAEVVAMPQPMTVPERELDSQSHDEVVRETEAMLATQPTPQTQPVFETVSVDSREPVQHIEPANSSIPTSIEVEVFQSESVPELEPQPEAETFPVPAVEFEVNVDPSSSFEPTATETIGQCEPEAGPVPPKEPDPLPPVASVPTGFVYDIDADFEDETDEIPFGFAAPEFADDVVPVEVVQSLRMENEQLRFELEQARSGPNEDSELLNREQTMKLVTRLEEMLSELRRADARSLQMEELLRSADQATQDEREERKQMESWVSELESRVTQRESEAEGEIQTLKKLLTEARQSQQQSNESLKRVLESSLGSGEAIPVDLVEGLRTQVESLQSQIDTAQTEARDLREQLSNREMKSQAAADLQNSEQKYAKMQLEVSRERAEISRQRADLKRLRAELEDRLNAPRVASDGDTRIQAMREHLKELHEKEEQAKANDTATTGGGLANRIASLLNRVTGE